MAKRLLQLATKNRSGHAMIQRKQSRRPPMYELLVIFHNLKLYDSHLLIKSFKKEYTQCLLKKRQKVVYGDLKVIAQTSEKFIIFSICKVRFINSCQFLPSNGRQNAKVLL
jgi:hypothetical protein